MTPTRSEAWDLLTEYTKSPNLIKHALAVEACMRRYAEIFGEDPETWGIAGLLHDLDYERWPDPEDHPFRGAEILRQRGYPEEIIQAVLGHAHYSGVPRETRMARALFAVDELAGFIVAVALVRDSKNLADVKVRSVMKKLKDAGFARGVRREDVEQGARELGIPLEEHIAHMLEAMRSVADGLELDGRLAKSS